MIINRVIMCKSILAIRIPLLAITLLCIVPFFSYSRLFYVFLLKNPYSLSEIFLTVLNSKIKKLLKILII
ncbi:LOW QUALITY PROTEIN: hypothetical protein HZS_804 [Henneguya salminicola]|nr:LOW QUALITY PROTEIN: hypothetical protein HZS_804 [Henneguya salminicola]